MGASDLWSSQSRARGRATVSRSCPGTSRGRSRTPGRGPSSSTGIPAEACCIASSNWRASRRVILVDSPPLSAAGDPFLLATVTRNLVMVLRAGTTDRHLALAKLDLLDRLPVRVLGAVLNDVVPEGAYRYYRYSAGYAAEDE